MESNLQSPPHDNSDGRATFRKPNNDAANRKYRRRSPARASSSSEGSPPQHEPRSSPVYQRDTEKGCEHRLGRRDNEKEMEIDTSRRQYGRSSGSYKYSERQPSRKDHGYSRHDEYVRYDKHVDEDDRFSSRSTRGLRSGTYSEHIRQESERERSRDYSRKMDKYSNDRYDGSRQRGKEKDSSSLDNHKYKDKDQSDGSGWRHGSSKSENMDIDRGLRDRDDRSGKTDYNRDSGDKKSKHITSHDESRGHLNDKYPGRDASKHSSKEAGKSQRRETYGDMPAKEEKKKYDEREVAKEKDQYGRTRVGELEDKSVMLGENQESASKKPKHVNLGNDTDYKDVDETDSYPKQTVESGNRFSQGQVRGNDTEVSNDPVAAKVAALKAAELVNRSLVGVGYMTTDQKKKLLWGTKKSTTGEESTHHWDTAHFGDRERQEKFNKLMGVKGDSKVEQNPDGQGGSGLLQAEKQKELQLDLEKQYTAGLRRRDGRTVGLGL